MRAYSIQSRRSQGGWVFLSIISLFAIMTLIVILGYSTFYSKMALLQLDVRQTVYLTDIRKAVENTYKTNAWEIDSFSGQATWRDPAKWQAVSGIAERWSLSSAVSNRIAKNGIYYTVIVFWMEMEGDSANPPSFNKVTGEFSPCPVTPDCGRKWIAVEGYPIQQEKFAQTVAVMNEIATKAETYFKARYAFDPDRDININYFRPITGVCSAPNEEDLPCLDQFTVLAGSPAQYKLAVDNQQTKNAWGQPIFISNKEDADIAEPPYSLVLRSELPWGGNYTMKALQQL